MRDRIRAHHPPGSPLAGDPCTSEALRRVHAQRDQDARRLLAGAAGRLPGNSEQPADRAGLSIALTIACFEQHPRLAQADETALRRAASDLAPHPVAGETVGEYAARLRLVAEGVCA
ncbi:hypothetical protein [Streptomyces sp. DH37]|uniref:hypothetical protein n=1 Tax=Streptomyces sp. DH37 TaxID=3040122 RepID=UPI002442CE41|nr:hypothetical protein [Streptomyces sp. DH37]MDG9703772.1 hypothetical protein [Streptomyces sp. DH37]